MILTIDTDTKNWILDASDEKAARAGHVMDLEAAEYAVNWIESNCLYCNTRCGLGDLRFQTTHRSGKG